MTSERLALFFPLFGGQFVVLPQDSGCTRLAPVRFLYTAKNMTHRNLADLATWIPTDRHIETCLLSAWNLCTILPWPHIGSSQDVTHAFCYMESRWTHIWLSPAFLPNFYQNTIPCRGPALPDNSHSRPRRDSNPLERENRVSFPKQYLLHIVLPVSIYSNLCVSTCLNHPFTCIQFLVSSRGCCWLC